jgi:Serine/threonine protein phosphatase
LISFGKSDTGKVRDINEDFIYVNDEKVGSLPNLYIVSDGMGGHKAGEIASSLAVNSFLDYVKNNTFANDDEILDFLVNAIDYANKMVYEKSISDIKCNGMGATFSVCTFVNNKIYAAHVGDSRIYLINKQIHQLSIDHTYVNEMVRVGKITQRQAKHHPQKNIITRAVGINENIEVDAFVEPYNQNDFVLICSDGLTSMLDDKEIFDTIKNNDLKSSIIKFIERANEKGGYDNISVILISGVLK